MNNTPATKIETKLDLLINQFQIQNSSKASNSTIKKNKKVLCYFHNKYGDKAIQPCNGPCEFKKKPSEEKEKPGQKLTEAQNQRQQEDDKLSDTCESILKYIKTTMAMPKAVSPIRNIRQQPRQPSKERTLQVYRVGQIPEFKLQEIKAEAKALNDKVKNIQKRRKTVIFPYNPECKS